jgi:hypothetical protein
MFEKFKRKDVVSELDKHIDEDQAIYVESEPNKSLFILYMLKPYMLFLFLFVIIDFLTVLLVPEEYSNFVRIFIIFIFTVNVAFIIFLIYKALEALSISINTYYIITNKGVHTTSGGRTLNYQYMEYTDISSISMKRNKFSNTGSVFIKTKAEKIPSSFLKKILYRRTGLIGVDDVNDIYIILEQIGKQENAELLAFDAAETIAEMDYFKDVKKYAEKMDTFDKNETLLDKRNKAQKGE